MTIKITITGTKGFLGNYLSQYLKSQPNTKIYELSSSINKMDKRYYFIGNEINEEILKDTDVLILCAHDFKNKDKYSGCTVHFVNSKLDSGKIILQKKVKIMKNDNALSLQKKILKEEYKLYPEALERLYFNP